MKVPAGYQDFFPDPLQVAPSVDELRQSILAYCECMKELGYHANPFSDNPTSQIQKASAKARVRAGLYLAFNFETLKELMASGEPVDDRRLLWRILAKAKLTPCTDIFDRIDKGDIVEIYLAREQVQIFRNLRFFEICSLSVEDMLFQPWYKVTKRTPWSYLPLFKAMIQLRLNKLKSTRSWDVATHRIVESFGENRQIDISMKYLSPVFANGKAVGCISTNSSIVI